MNSRQLFEKLIEAEHESDVVRLLDEAGYSLDDDAVWTPLGDNAGNFSVVGNQQEDAAAALIEKVVNSIDAVLMGECLRRDIEPESAEAPTTMQAAVERFFKAQAGRLENLPAQRQRELAERINVVATGEKDSPCYSIVDRGEGQEPDRFSDTFLSTSRSSPKIKIDFVQGKFNAGGSGSLQFCGKHNIQLVASRRQPFAQDESSPTANHWGFTVIRRQRPRRGERSSVFVYLAPGGTMLSFRAGEVRVLPGKSSPNSPPRPYAETLEYGTVIKLYNYRWAGRGLATLEARRQLERVLHTPCLPFRIWETRAYRANYYATTVSGVWDTLVSERSSESAVPKMEAGFPANAAVTPPGDWRASDQNRSVEKRSGSQESPDGCVLLGQRPSPRPAWSRV